MRSGMRSGHFLSNLVHPLEGSPYGALQILLVRKDALAEAGISERLRRPLVSTELAAALARCLRSSADYPTSLSPYSRRRLRD